MKLAHYIEQYDHEHSAVSNKVLHAIGIPMIFAGLVLFALLKWVWGAVFFVGGWTLLFLGHRIEGNKPAFFQGVVYLMVGPIWVAKEIWAWVSGAHPPNGSQAGERKRS